jgi:hypothetical protein
MSQAIDKHLAKAIIDVALFLEFSDEEVLDADTAVEAMENLAAELQLMSGDAKNGLVERFHELASAYGDQAEFVEELPESLGLSASD